MKKKRLKIAETYLKLDLDFNEKRNQELEIIFRKAAEKSIRDFKYSETLVYKIEFDKGSTKAKVIFFAFLNGMIFYADLKDSIKTIYNDIKWLSERVITNAREESNLIDNNIIRTERRTGIIGRLNKVLTRIDFLQNNLNNLGNNQALAELNQLYQEVANLMQLLEDVERQTFIRALPQEIRHNLPAPNQNDVRHFELLYAIKPEEDE
ncbi:hypothetical protein [Larkinella humicola]|uniref:Uncharacterized protein n=1 Tax=Larkinella humicola TaxID=2607654 RepID=A0A5N1JBY4_9BACT|nr:hypothetical protein [Larkinella humicola]KAA9352789.1 hypothetical protein F0P93_16510 [Larkinella humicola]